MASTTPVDYDDDKKDLSVSGPSSYVVDAAYDDSEREPTEEERLTLRKISGPMTWVAVLVCFVEFAERASYYSATGVFSNFINRPLPVGGNGAGAVAPGAAGLEENAGALDMGAVAATAITTMFSFLAFCLPMFIAPLADSKWGRYKTVMSGVIIGALAHALLIIPAIPAVIKKVKAAQALFIIALLALAFATAFIKPSLNPLLCDQNPVKRQTIKRLPSGELVIVDPTTTIERYQIVFYWCINFGSVFALSTSYAARDVGYWLAFLIPGIVYVIMCILLRMVGPKLVKAPPTPGIYGEVGKVFSAVLSNGGWKGIFSRKNEAEFWDKAKPSVIATQGTFQHKPAGWISWDDTFVDEVRVAVNCVKVFGVTVVYAFIDGGLGTAQNLQAGVLKKDGLPNDLLGNFTPIAIIIFAPILNHLILPGLRKAKIPFGGCYRMIVGFIFGGLSMAIAAIIQSRVYAESACGHYASTCATSTDISLWWQLPMYALPGMGELLVITTAYEIAYTRAPARLKGIVYATVLFSFSLAYALILIVSDYLVDPNLVWPFVGGAVACGVCAICLGVFFRSLNDPMPNFQDSARMGLVREDEKDVEA